VLIEKAGITRLIPHAGAMCLLDAVLDWDAIRIRCVTTSHRDMENPLRRSGQLGILCGVEYAAQSMALHGSLASTGVDTARSAATGAGTARSAATGAGTARSAATGAGYLASVRDLACHTDRLDLLTGVLIVEAERLHGDAERAIYGFALRHDDRILLNGRAAVVLRAAVP
jgi:predicted hotdog family 3-hydroxylacyl-ACP dehydratase